MQTKNNNIFYHLVAFLTVAIWGTTFVSTKVLMLNGLSPAQIFTLRFSIAYVLMLAFNHRRLFADSWADEAKMALLGITGGSLYFCSENEAMNFTTTTAFLTVAIWGTTFVSTKVLMLNGLSPAQIFTLRFSIAYVLMLAFNHRRLFADSWADEAKMALLGITGGSLYFCSENEAMNFTTTTNTSLIVCSCPLFATLLVRLDRKSTRLNSSHT